MNAVKKSITLPKMLDSFIFKRAKAAADLRGEQPNYSAAIADLIIEARQREMLETAASKSDQKSKAGFIHWKLMAALFVVSAAVGAVCAWFK